MKRPTWQATHIGICKLMMERSKCIKYRTGAVITKGDRVLASGYNGTCSKTVECYDYWREYYIKRIKPMFRNRLTTFKKWKNTAKCKSLHSKWSINHEMHAEMNALRDVTRADIDDTCALYTYLSPCEQCAKNILAYGIKTVYYKTKYMGRPKGNVGGLEFLQNNGVNCIQYI